MQNGDGESQAPCFLVSRPFSHVHDFSLFSNLYLDRGGGIWNRNPPLIRSRIIFYSFAENASVCRIFCKMSEYIYIYILENEERLLLLAAIYKIFITGLTDKIPNSIGENKPAAGLQ